MMFNDTDLVSHFSPFKNLASSASVGAWRNLASISDNFVGYAQLATGVDVVYMVCGKWMDEFQLILKY
ncbi:hypothetical protein C5167_015568 [Papaver somniferum]|uniref:Uncharacterized protein n=1 Tax=Papaver somniferum TaxID=3469 RepID=A0A4Y7J9R5_PAPSO|nr:hypothetical protein C5167_015210 [Papaver somniferum]RZC56724.1 hypothetical protein C5167_015568 [Papaver somniferum]